MNLSLLFSFKTEVWTKITVTSLKSVDFRWCKRLNILFSSLSLFNLPYFLLSLPHMTFPIELLLPCLFFFASFFFFFFSQHFPVNISVLHGQYNWQAGVVPSIHWQEEYFMAEPQTGQTTSPQMKSSPSQIPVTVKVPVISGAGFGRRRLSRNSPLHCNLMLLAPTISLPGSVF